MGNLYCAREHSVQFFVQFFYTFKLHRLTTVDGALKGNVSPNYVLSCAYFQKLTNAHQNYMQSAYTGLHLE